MKIKTVLKIFFFILVTLIVLSVALPYLFRDRIKAKVLENIDSKINATVNFSRISFSAISNFPHFSVSLHHVTVLGINEFNGDTLVSADEIHVSFNIFRFLKGREIEINGIKLIDPFIHARVLADGKTNFNILKPDSTPENPAQKKKTEINIEKWSIKNGRIIYDDKLQKTYIEVDGLNHKGSGDFKQDISDLDITTQISELTVAYNGVRYLNRKKFAANLQMEMNFKENKFIFKDHDFMLGDFKFGFDGFFKLLETGYQTDLVFSVKKTSFKDLISLLPGIYDKDLKGIKARGDFTCSGFVKGVYDAKAHKVPHFHIDLNVNDGEFKYTGLPEAVENINFHLIADNEDGMANHGSFDMKAFHLEINKKAIHGNFRLDRRNNTYIKADIKLAADLAELEKIYPVKDLVLRGDLSSEIKIDGNYNDSLKQFPKVDAFLSLKNGYIKSKASLLDMDSLSLKTEVSNSTGIIADTRISLTNICFILDGEPFKISGTISDLKDYNYDLKVSGLLDLGKLTKLYPIQDAKLSGTLNFDYLAQGSLSKIEAKQFNLLNTSGTLEVKNLSYKSKDLAFPLHIDDALLTFSPEKIELDRFTAEFGYSNVTLSGHLYNYMPFFLKHDSPIKGDLTLNCDTIDFNQWFPKSVPPAASVSSASPGSSSSLVQPSSKAEVLVIPKNIGFTLTSDIKTVKFGKMDIVGLTGSATVKDGVLTLSDTRFSSMNSKFILNGDYNTQSAKDPRFDLNIDVDRLDIVKAYAMFIDDKEKAPAEGNFSTNYNLKGNLTPDFSPIYGSLIGNGKITIDQVTMKGMKLMNHIKNVSHKEEFNDPSLNDIAIDTEIKGGKLFIHPFTFKVNKFLTEVEGFQDFNSNVEYLIKLSAPPFNRIKIPVSISGTTDKPVIKLGNGFEKTDFEKL